jgi:hypothetical protein
VLSPSSGYTFYPDDEDKNSFKTVIKKVEPVTLLNYFREISDSVLG